MSEGNKTASGGCLCGAVRYAAAGAPLWVAHCHCQSCRHSTGAPFSTFAGYPHGQVTFTGAAPGTFASSPDVTRSFCGACGTPIAYQSHRFPGEIHLYVCTMDEPASFSPQGHVHTVEQLDWLHIDDTLPRHRTTSSAPDPAS